MTSSVSQIRSASSLLPSRSLVWTCRLLCSIALCISGYLAWTAFSASDVIGCGGSIFDCGHVLTSKYSKVLGIPVSVPAFGLYASLLVVLAYVRSGVPDYLLKVAWGVLTFGALSAGMAAMWFIGLQIFAIGHYCPWCLGAHACGLSLAGIVLWKRPLEGKLTMWLVSASLAGIALLMTAQMMAKPPKTYTVERFDDTGGSVASLDGEQFDAPEDLDAPIDFAPPGEDDGLFAPPVVEPPPTFEPPVVADNEFLPPADAIPTKSPRTAGDTSEAAIPESATGADKPKKSLPDVTSTRTKDRPESAENDPAARAATAALLFISPSTTSFLARLLPADDTNPTSVKVVKKSNAAAETTEVKKPVVPKAVPARLVAVSGNKFRLNTRQWPILGDPDAKYIFVEMFDYTCPHCRNTHKAIDGAFDKLGKDLAIIALPVPLDGSCNNTVRNTHPSHREACELARIAVAVWRIDRDQFKTFHDWMFEGNRTAGQARHRAAQLVGQQKLNAELALPHAKSYVTKHVDLYKRVGQGTVPKLMFPQSTMTGEVNSPVTLVNTIQRELGK